MSSIVIQGDTSGSITVEAPSVAGTHTLTLPKATGNIATDATVGLGQKNLIINGDMRIAQRSTSETGLTSTGYYTVDRFSFVNDTLGTWTMSQDSDIPTGQGFANSLKIACTTADASPASGDRLAIRHAFEGNNIASLNYGSASAKNTTLSFWVKSNKTGTYIAELYGVTSNRQISQAYTISSANTWEKKTLTFVGDTSGTYNIDNSSELLITLYMGVGSGYTSGTLSTSWTASNNVDRAVGQVNLADSTSNYINITGIQLEVGENATPFENRSYGTELALCQRYYWKMTGVQYAYVGMGFSESGFGNYYCKLPVTMRTNPTVSISNLKAFNGVSNPSITGVRSTLMTPDAGVVQYYHTASAGSVYGAFIDPSTGYAAFSAEL
jgi:hypothetical protein